MTTVNKYENYEAEQTHNDVFWHPPDVEHPEALVFPFFTKRPSLHMIGTNDIDYFISALEELSQLIHEISVNTPLPGSNVNLALREYLLLHITTFVDLTFRSPTFIDMLEPKSKYDDKILSYLSFLRECREQFIRRWDLVCWLEHNVVNASVNCLRDANSENCNDNYICSTQNSINNTNRTCKKEVLKPTTENEVGSRNVLKANNVYRKECGGGGDDAGNEFICQCEELHSTEKVKRVICEPRYTTRTKKEFLKKIIESSSNDKMSECSIDQIRECWTSVKLCADAISMQTSAIDNIRERLAIKFSVGQFLLMCAQKCTMPSNVCTLCLFFNTFVIAAIIALAWLMWHFQEFAFLCAILSTILCTVNYIMAIFFMIFMTQKNGEDINFYSSLLTTNVTKSYYFHNIAEKLSMHNKSSRELSMSTHTFGSNIARLLKIKELVLDKMIIMIGVINYSDLRICVWNVGAQRATGISWEQIIGKSLEAVLDMESIFIARVLIEDAENVSQEPRRIVINSFNKHSVLISAVATPAHIDGVRTVMLVGNAVEEDNHVMASYLSHTALTALQMQMEENDVNLQTYKSLLNEAAWNAIRERSTNATQWWRLSTLVELLSPLEALCHCNEQQQEKDKFSRANCSGKRSHICVHVFIDEYVPEQFECETAKVHCLFTEICRVAEELNKEMENKSNILSDSDKCYTKREAGIINNNKYLREATDSHNDVDTEFCNNLNEGSSIDNENTHNHNNVNSSSNNNNNNYYDNINNGNVKISYDSDSDSEKDVYYFSGHKSVNPCAMKCSELNVCLEWRCNADFRCHLMQVVVEIIPVRGIFALSNFTYLSQIVQESGYLISTESNQFTLAIPVSVSLLTSNHVHLQMCHENKPELEEQFRNNETSTLACVNNNKINNNKNNDNNNNTNKNKNNKNNNNNDNSGNEHNQYTSTAENTRVTEWLKSINNNSVSRNKFHCKSEQSTMQKGKSTFELAPSSTKTNKTIPDALISQETFTTNAKQMLLCTFIICEPDEVYLAHLRNLCSLYQHRVFFTESMETFLPLLRTFGNDLTAVIVSCASEQYNEFRQTCHEYNVKFVATEDKDVVSLVAFSASRNDGPPANCSDVHYVLHKPIEVKSWIRFLEFLHEVKVKEQIISRPTHNELHVIRKLGEGSNSRVDLVSEEYTGGVFALKTIFSAASNAVGTSSEEVEILMYLGNHPNIVQYIRSYYNNRNQLCICLEHCKEGNLSTYINTLPCHRLTLRHFASIAFQMIDVLHYIHGKGVAHRDINPSNILLYNLMHVKLADFGSATRYPQLAGKVCGGTIRYIAPERLIEIDNHRWYKNEMDRLYAEDVWSLGITFLDLLGTCPTLEREMNDISHFVEFYLKLREGNKELKFEISQELMLDEREERVGFVKSNTDVDNDNANSIDTTDSNRLSKHCTFSNTNTAANNAFVQHILALDGNEEEERTKIELNLAVDSNDQITSRKDIKSYHSPVYGKEYDDKILLNTMYVAVKSMISSMLQLHPSKRASAKSLCKCRFMTCYRSWQSNFQSSVSESKH